jgi:hypothetical protein
MDEWFCEIAGREIGPLSAQQLRAMAGKGQILPSDCVRRGAQGAWVLARQVKGLLPPPAMPLVSPLRAPTEGRSGERQSTASPLPLGEGQGVRVVGQVGNLSQGGPHPNPLPKGEGTGDEDIGSVPEMFVPEPATDAPGAFSFDIDRASIASEFRAQRNVGIPVLSDLKRRQRQDRKKALIGLLAAGLVALLAASLILSLRTNDQEPGKTGIENVAREARAEKAAPKATENSPRESAVGADKRAAKPASVANWVDASTSPAVVGDVSVKIALVAKAPSHSGRADEGWLLIAVEVRNLGATRKVDFAGWTRDGIAQGARLTDNFGNPYRPKPIGRVSVAGQGPPMSIYPNKSGREVLAFEPPIEKVEFLRLELSAVAFGNEDVVRLRIPAKMITARADLIEPKGAKSSGSGDASKTPAKKSRTPRPNTPEGDFGIGPDDPPP